VNGMHFNDRRSFKVVVMADYFMNPQGYAGLPDTSRLYETVRDLGYGVIKMPPPDIPASAAAQWVLITADQIQEYTNRGFRVVLLGIRSLPQAGIWLDDLGAELRRRQLNIPRSIVISGTEAGSSTGLLKLRSLLET
jgi:hypothetical protein